MCFFHQTVNPARRFGLCICCAFSCWKQSYSFLKLHVICWLYTRALKYILIVLGTYSESKGVKYISTSTLLADHGKIRSSAKPKFVAKYGALTICTEISAENFLQMVLVFSSAPKTRTGLSCTIYKIQVKFSLSLEMKPGASNPNKWYRKFRLFRRKREGNTSKGITFFAENFHWDEPFYLNSPRNFRVFHTNGKRSWSTPHWRTQSLRLFFVFCFVVYFSSAPEHLSQ